MAGETAAPPRATLIACRDLGRAWFAALSGSRVVEVRLAEDAGPLAEGAVVRGRAVRGASPGGPVFVDVGAARPAIVRLRPGGPAVGAGDTLLVQIAHPGRDGKGARATTGLRLPSWNVVLIPGGEGVRVSRGIDGEAEREALARRVLRAVGARADRFGLVARRAAARAPDAEIAREIAALAEAWEAALADAGGVGAPAIVRAADPPALRFALRHGLMPTDRAVADEESGGAFNDPLRGAPPVVPSSHDGPLPAFDAYGLARALDRALATAIELPGGGRLGIRELEAMTVVDVDAAADRRGALAVDLEAAAELAAQVRLRNAGGLVVADFVDPPRETDRRTVDVELAAHLAADSARANALPMSALGIVEMTRARRGPSLAEALASRCAACGAGHVVDDGERARALLRRARRLASNGARGVTIRAPAPVLAEARSLAESLGGATGLPAGFSIKWREGADAVEPGR